MMRAGELYDAAIVLGGGRYDEGTLTPLSTMRLDKGWQLYRDGIVPRILVLGGTRGTYFPTAKTFMRPGAELRREYLCAKGHSRAEDIIEVNDARDTIWEAFAARERVRREGFTTILLVTSREHMPRALFIFQRIFNGTPKIEGGALGEVETGDILIPAEERAYFERTRATFDRLPKEIPIPPSWMDWYDAHCDLYQAFTEIHDRFHPPGHESQAYTGVDR